MRAHPLGPLLLLLGVIPLTACEGGGTFGDDDDSAARTLDVSSVAAAPVLVAYSAGVRVQGWGGDAVFSVESGTLPPGIALSESGALMGTPTWLGSYTATVRATGMPFADSVGPVTIDVVDNGALGLGFLHDQLNNMQHINEGPLMSDPWIRIGGGGEPGMDTYTFDVGAYDPGPDGVAELGYGDDVRVGDLEGVTASVESWEGATPEWDMDDPVTLDGLTVTAHEDTGSLLVRFAHPDFDPVVTRVLAVPPDFCPLGKHAGGPWTPGQCE